MEQIPSCDGAMLLVKCNIMRRPNGHDGTILPIPSTPLARVTL